MSARVANRDNAVIEIKSLKAEGEVENRPADPGQIRQESWNRAGCPCVPQNFMGEGGGRLLELAREPISSDASSSCSAARHAMDSVRHCPSLERGRSTELKCNRAAIASHRLLPGC